MKKTFPKPLWIALAMTGIMGGARLFPGVSRGSPALLCAAFMNLVLVPGLALGQPWAYSTALAPYLIAKAGAVGEESAIFGPEAFLVNALVVVPLLLSTRYFFSFKKKGDSSSEG